MEISVYLDNWADEQQGPESWGVSGSAEDVQYGGQHQSWETLTPKPQHSALTSYSLSFTVCSMGSVWYWTGHDPVVTHTCSKTPMSTNTSSCDHCEPAVLMQQPSAPPWIWYDSMYHSPGIAHWPVQRGSEVTNYLVTVWDNKQDKEEDSYSSFLTQ